VACWQQFIPIYSTQVTTMSNEKANEKRRLIAQMIAMQKRRLAGAESDDETPSEYRGAFEEMATRVVDLAHKERGTSR